jgi:hypothetical protein
VASLERPHQGSEPIPSDCRAKLEGLALVNTSVPEKNPAVLPQARERGHLRQDFEKPADPQQRNEFLIVFEQPGADVLQNQLMRRMITHVPRGQPPTDQGIVAKSIALMSPVAAQYARNQNRSA